MKYLIGIDLGTQATKSTLCREDGQIVCETSEQTRLIYPEPGAVEQDPEEMLMSVINTIGGIMAKSGISPHDVAGIGFDGQMAGIMAVDKDGMAATMYDSWLDTRCGKYREPFLALGEEHVISLTGGPITYAHGPKVLWLKNERPDIYKNVASFVQPAAYCVMRLCGLTAADAYIDYTYLHFSGFSDTKNKKWSTDLLDELKVDRNKMPRIVAPWDVVGKLTADASAKCGLLEGTPVIAGCGDSAASSFGAGVHRPGLLFDIAGTAAILACAVKDYAPDIKHKTLLFCPSVLEDLYTPMAYINGGGMCLKWMRDDVLSGKFTYAELNKLAEGVAPGSEDLLFIPHFSGRVCPNDTKIRGSYVNLSWNHNHAHMYRAILEGISYEYGLYADIIHELAPDLTFERVITVGGGSASPLFRQIKADVLGTEFVTIHAADTAAIASCALAGYGVGLYQTPTALVEKLIKTDKITKPEPSHFGLYSKRKSIYADVITSLHGVYSSLQGL